MILRQVVNVANKNLFQKGMRRENCWEITTCKKPAVTDIARYGKRARYQTFNTKSGKLELSTHSYPGGYITREPDGTYMALKLEGPLRKGKEIVLGKFDNFPDFAAAVRRFLILFNME